MGQRTTGLRYRGRRPLMLGPAAVAASRLVTSTAGRYVARRGAQRAAMAGIVAGGAATTAGVGYAAHQKYKTRGVKRLRTGAPKRTYNKASSQMADVFPTIRKNVTLAVRKPIDKRTLKLGFNYRVLRWQRVNNLNTGSGIPGALVLSHTTINNDWTVSPCYLMCLNHTNNSTTTTNGPMYQLQFNNNGGVQLAFQNAQNSDNTITQAKWAAEKTYPNIVQGTNDPEVRYIMNAWYDIRLNCYGANSQPTVYDISIISMIDDYLDPFEIPSSAQEVADRHSTWQGMVQRYMSNPILPVVTPKRKFRVHAACQFTLQPTLNIENDATPQSRIVRMFIRDGSLYDYCYHGDGFSGVGADDRLSTTQWVSQGTVSSLDYSDMPAAKARKWLVIRALNTTRSTVEDRTNTPSFDICVRKGEYMQAR